MGNLDFSVFDVFANLDPPNAREIRVSRKKNGDHILYTEGESLGTLSRMRRLTIENRVNTLISATYLPVYQLRRDI